VYLEKGREIAYNTCMNGSEEQNVLKSSEAGVGGEAVVDEEDEDGEAVGVDHGSCEGLVIDDRMLPTYIEAMLMATDKPMPLGKLAAALPGVGAGEVEAGIGLLNALYEQTGRSFRVEKLAGGYQILTLPEFEDFVAAIHKTRSSNKLRATAMETLSIVAYKQPILRAELEAIRGVACGEVLRGLMERHLVKIVGRAEEIGRPMLYGTTRQFLEVFGLSNLKDLPNAESLVPKKQHVVIEIEAEEGQGVVAQSASEQSSGGRDTEAVAGDGGQEVVADRLEVEQVKIGDFETEEQEC